ncbi:hypothetical protein ID866_10778 [Astraeus odoratus]|nr:hypothetical protein ID866_10778 [Astraeus odoratus]
MTQLHLLLQQVSCWTATCGIDLNDHVARDDTVISRTGSSAIVHQGVLRPQGKAVAVKTLRFTPYEEETALRIVTEAHRWSKIQHPNVLPMFGVVTKFDFAVSFVSEWADKGNAFDYIQNTDKDPRPLLLDITRGLHYLHNHEDGPIVHGDLRGRNVLVANDGRAILGDFGLSSLFETSFDTSVAAPIRPTIRWMAPEDIENFGNPTTASDVWAFGMTALELFTRQAPFHEIQSLRAVLTQIPRGPPDRPSEGSTLFRLTDKWWDTCNLCWVRNQSKRPTMLDIGKTLEMDLVPIVHAND